MLLIFLDVNGVLINSNSITKGKETREPWNSSWYHVATIDPECMLLLKKIIDETNAKIVVSSDWRNTDFLMTALKRAMINAGFEREILRESIIGRTPGKDDGNRSGQISEFIASFNKPIEKYIVLDDSFVAHHKMAEPLPRYFEGGLKEETANMIINYFRS